MPMSEFRNLNGKRVCDISSDKKYVDIRLKDCITRIYGFTPSVSGAYKITQKKISGDHEIRLYGSDFTPLYDGYFYDRSFDLAAGTLYYITVTHYRGADTSESYLQIYKEA